MLHARGLNPWANPVCMLPWQRAGLGKCASPCVQYVRAARNLENIRNLARAEEPLSLPPLPAHRSAQGEATPPARHSQAATWFHSRRPGASARLCLCLPRLRLDVILPGRVHSHQEPALSRRSSCLPSAGRQLRQDTPTPATVSEGRGTGLTEKDGGGGKCACKLGGT